MSIAWEEAACLVRTWPTLKAGDGPNREILAEGTFADIAKIFGRYRVDEWDSLTISFTERHHPPFRYESEDFARHVVSRIIQMGH